MVIKHSFDNVLVHRDCATVISAAIKPYSMAVTRLVVD
jgi:hypothetical protein